MRDDLVGREREQAELRSLLVAHPVVYLYGAAGAGKTALAFAVCRAAEGEGELPPLAYVSMAHVSDPREALERTARTLGAMRPTAVPERVPDALAALLEATPRMVVWDDLAVSQPLADMVRRVAEGVGASRLLLVARRYYPASEATVRVPSLGVPPLPLEAAVELVARLEAERGRTLAEDLAMATGCSPLLIRLALAQGGTAHLTADPGVGLRRMIGEHAVGPARAVLELLLCAEGWLMETEIVTTVGRPARAALDELRRYLLVVKDGGRVAITPPLVELVRGVLGDPEPEAWSSLAAIAERQLTGAPQDPDALLLVCRAHIEQGDVARALEVLRGHSAARAAAPSRALDRVLRDIAARLPEARATAFILLAREQLRWGDYEAARRTLADLPTPAGPDDAERLALLRAECLVRAGEPDMAQRAMDTLLRPPHKRNKRETSSPAVELTFAQLALLRGELVSARQRLLRLGPRTAKVPHLEARRATVIAMSYLYEERYDEARAWIARARAAQVLRGGVPPESAITIIDHHAMLDLGQIEQAEQLVSREGSEDREVAMLRASTLLRRGELSAALEVGMGALASLNRRADLLFRSVVTRDLASACIGLGRFAEAEEMLRIAVTGADQQGLAMLHPFCDTEWARLEEARGDLRAARRRIDKAHARLSRSPYVAIEHAYFHGDSPAASVEKHAPDAMRAFGWLREGEQALRAVRVEAPRRDLNAALDAAEAAETWYKASGIELQTARARLVRAEALARLGENERALEAVTSCETVAEPHGYVPVIVACALVRAFVADSAGDIAAYVSAMARARAAAHPMIADPALAAACERIGLGVPEVATKDDAGGSRTTARTFKAQIVRLGLARHAQMLWHIGERIVLRAEDEVVAAGFACVIDVVEGRVWSGDSSIEIPEQRLKMLEVLAEGGEAGATLEDLYIRVWGGVYHPLRHRNGLYVALTRLKTSLAPLGRDVRILHEGPHYRLTSPGRVAMRRRVDALLIGRRANSRVTSAGMAPEAYAAVHRVSLAEAAWELALLAATTT